MPSTPQRGFIVRPTLENTEPEFESVNIQACSDPYSFTSDEGVSTSRWGIPVSNGILSTSLLYSVEERIKDRMLEKIEDFLESNQLNELSVLVTVYEKFKELHT